MLRVVDILISTEISGIIITETAVCTTIHLYVFAFEIEPYFLRFAGSICLLQLSVNSVEDTEAT